MNRMVLAVLGVAGLAAACGNGDPVATTPTQGPASAPVAAGADAVAAALHSEGTPVANLRFALGAAPAVGVPVSLRLDVSASAPVQVLLLVAEGDGVAVDPATARVSLSLPEVGKTASHQLQVTPQRTGLAEVTVRLTDVTTGSQAAVYGIPVLVPAAGATQ